MRPEYEIDDDLASVPREAWADSDDSSSESLRHVVESICSNEDLWGIDLASLPGFVDTVLPNVEDLVRQTVRP